MALTLENLPIYSILPNIYNFLTTHEKGAIIGKTGIGKSLGIPGYIASSTSPGIKCYVAVPNLHTAKTLARQQKRIIPNVITGYADRYNPEPTDSKLVYTTFSYVKELFMDSIGPIRDKPELTTSKPDSISPIRGKPESDGIAKITILFIDEAHLTNIDNYIIIKLWEFFKNNRPGMKIPRLYLLSAQIDTRTYPSFMMDQIYKIDLKSYPITIKYSHRNYDVKDRSRYFDLIKLVVEQHKTSDPGTFLIFAPGRKEINFILKKLEDLKLPGVILVPAYGDASSETLEKVYSPVYRGERKMVISTNVFESVVTIENVIAVFDSMLEKRRTSNENAILETVEISKASAEQRAGRTGRTNPGTCYRMCDQNRYLDLSDFKALEIYQVPIYNILVKLIASAFPANHIISLFPVEIRYKIPESIGLLKRLNMITDVAVTDLGLFYYKTGLSVRSAAILWWWIKSAAGGEVMTNLYGGLIVALLINNYSDGYLNYNQDVISSSGFAGGTIETPATYKQRLFKYREEKFSHFRGRSDLHTYMKIWSEFLRFRTKFLSLDKKLQINSWCEQFSLKTKKFIFLNDNINYITNILSNEYGINIPEQPYDVNEIVTQITPILVTVYNDKQYLLVDDYYSNVSGGGHLRYKLDTEYTVNEYNVKLPNKVISFVEMVTDRSQIIKFSVDLSLTDTRLYDPNTITLKPRIPVRGNKPNFPGVIAESSVIFPEMDERVVLGRMDLEPEIPEQNVIPIGQIFPIN